MRLDRFLSQQLGVSRRFIATKLREKKVTVDGKLIDNGAIKITHQQTVMFDGDLLHKQVVGRRYFMLNKPQCYVCSTADPDHPTVLNFLDEPAAYKLHAAGRLDIDATGLVLLTDDGQWSHRVTSPKYYCEKTYLVTLAYPLANDVIRQFMAGIQLHGEKTLTRPARLVLLKPELVRLTISEGRYHQVKRMFAACGNLVTGLHRECIGEIVLDNSLAAGEYRSLTEWEITSMIAPQK